ncbi:hypothetical protein [Mesomycoplasma ovipneumoniae]|uniref:hypothetical protein n=1 Tax=Mesomycoplasma ovipneumoniae TaxID=29562 RepID=UPI00311B1BCC
MGDTNIRTENTEKLFESTLSHTFYSWKDEKTSLSSKFGNMQILMTKFFIKDLSTRNAQKYKLYSIFEKI